MWKSRLFSAACLVLSSAVCAGPALTEAENRWLTAGAPVLAYAEQQKLPLDVIVQPAARPGSAPLAMAFIDGRCKLVLSMRGNLAAEVTLAGAAPELAPMLIQTMVAHELAHCWRHLQGAWNLLPAGFVEVGDDDDGNTEHVRMRKHMREARREEGFADLVGLAWTLKHHPQRYAEVHGWLARFRDVQPVAGGHHDTRAWVRLAKDPAAFAAAPTLFEQAAPLWREGLLSDE